MKPRVSVEPEYCDCPDCEASDPCQGDCPSDGLCYGCHEAREDEKDREFEAKRAQGIL